MRDGKHQDDRRIAAQANQWLRELAHPQMADHAAFTAWLTASPRHVEEFLLSTACHKALADSALARREVKVQAAVEAGWRRAARPEPKKKPSRRRRIAFLSLTLGLTGFAALAAIRLLEPHLTAKPPPRDNLQFTGQTLAEAVEEFNRYNGRKLVIRDPQVAALRISGRFALADIDTFIATLEGPFGIEAVESGPPGFEAAILRLQRPRR
jgi:ferric-dicitrate binding protein FerR (iron transport regulator)